MSAGGWMKITKTMALTEKMFLATLPRALNSEAYSWDGRQAVLAAGGRTFAITFEAQDNFALGGFSVPRADVTLELDGYSDEEAEEAVARFERYFHRGGG